MLAPLFYRIFAPVCFRMISKTYKTSNIMLAPLFYRMFAPVCFRMISKTYKTSNVMLAPLFLQNVCSGIFLHD